MNDEDHDPCGDLVAHHGEKDQACSHEMMKHPLIVFFIVLFYYHQLENRENMYAQLEAEINFQLWPLPGRPVRILPIYL